MGKCNMQEKNIKIGLVGFGTVGAGVAKIILENANAIAAKTGLRLELACVVDADLKRPRPVKLPDGLLTNDLNIKKQYAASDRRKDFFIRLTD